MEFKFSKLNLDILICPNSNALIGNFILLFNLKGCITGTHIAIFYSVFPCSSISVILPGRRRKKHVPAHLKIHKSEIIIMGTKF